MSIAPLLPDAQFLLGRYFWLRGEYRRSQIAMKWAVATVPGRLAGLENLALLGSMMGRPGQSAIAYWRAVMSGTNATALLAKISERMDRLEVKAALCLNPGDGEAMCFLALAIAGEGEVDPGRRRLAHADITATNAGSTALVGRVALARARLL